MPEGLTQADLDALAAWDTPTICNALEIVVPERRALGFNRRPLVAPFPDEVIPLPDTSTTIALLSQREGF